MLTSTLNYFKTNKLTIQSEEFDTYYSYINGLNYILNKHQNSKQGQTLLDTLIIQNLKKPSVRIAPITQVILPHCEFIKNAIEKQDATDINLTIEEPKEYSSVCLKIEWNYPEKKRQNDRNTIRFTYQELNTSKEDFKIDGKTKLNVLQNLLEYSEYELKIIENKLILKTEETTDDKILQTIIQNGDEAINQIETEINHFRILKIYTLNGHCRCIDLNEIEQQDYDGLLTKIKEKLKDKHLEEQEKEFEKFKNDMNWIEDNNTFLENGEVIRKNITSFQYMQEQEENKQLYLKIKESQVIFQQLADKL